MEKIRGYRCEFRGRENSEICDFFPHAIHLLMSLLMAFFDDFNFIAECKMMSHVPIALEVLFPCFCTPIEEQI